MLCKVFVCKDKLEIKVIGILFLFMEKVICVIDGVLFLCIIVNVVWVVVFNSLFIIVWVLLFNFWKGFLIKVYFLV